MSAQIRVERNDCYDILERTQKGPLDVTPWLEWFLSCLGRAFDAPDAGGRDAQGPLLGGRTRRSRRNSRRLHHFSTATRLVSIPVSNSRIAASSAAGLRCMWRCVVPRSPVGDDAWTSRSSAHLAQKCGPLFLDGILTGTSAVFGNTTIVEVTNVCEGLGYTLMVETHLDSHEISLKFESISGVLSLNNRRVTFSEKPDVDWAEEEAKRKAHEQPVPVKWSDLLATLRNPRNPPRSKELRDVLPGYFVVRGTISDVEVRQRADGPNTYTPVAEIYFRESPAVPHWRPGTRPIPEFNVCTDRLEILQETFGADFRTSMIGKTVEVHGLAFGYDCYGQRASLQIYLGRQIRPVPSVVFAADARVWVPPPVVVPPPRRAPTSAEIEADIVSRANYATSEVEFLAKARMNAACAERTDKALNANPGNRDAIVKEYSACQAAVNAEAATERQKAQACAQQVIRTDPANPDGTSRDLEGLQRALRACTQAAASGPPPGSAPVAAPARPALVTPFGPAPQTPNLMVACETRMKRDYPDGGQSNPDAYSKAYRACLEGR